MGINVPFVRRHRAARVAANDSMIALMIGRELGQSVLAEARPLDLLTQVAPGLPSVARLNRTSADAVAILAGAEQQMVYMAIPYVVSIHHRFLGDALEFIDGGRGLFEGNPHQVELKKVHGVLEGVLSEALKKEFNFRPAEVEAFEFVRYLRNRLVHHRGLAGAKLSAAWNTAAGKSTAVDNGQAVWTRIAGRPFPLVGSREQLSLGSGELFAALAVSKRLVDGVEDVLAAAVEPEGLAEAIVLDYQSQFPDRFAERSRRLRRLAGFRRAEYLQATSVGDDELEAASARLFP